MPSIDVTAAPQRFLTMSVDGYSPGRNRPGNCARWTYFAIGGVPNTTPLPSAIAAWENAPKQHRHPIIDGKTRIPRGMVIALGPTNGPRWAGDKNWMYGDVFTADGDGVGYDSGGPATDSLAGLGVIGRVTIRQRIAQTGGRPLLGFLSSYGGWDLTSTPTPTPGAPAHTPVQEDDMAAPAVYTDGRRFVGGDETTGLFTFGSMAELNTWQKNNPVVRQVSAGTLDKLVQKAVAK
ncbi:hypothetical protein Csp2054_14340 [Curtobacterium sp. 'Ferrero']|uniref:hypothetical protein n=1 Tax=Curtobacterium sp. 'Ferrero' TaxID=2033654 RepID=UPI000BD50A34|nr:hypothetical protein [Curtobacterium sp. 'Ferrero']PCN47018.1 hypothetical protein Csp2054_14340 [Curtobacterium sp. 'Ferrero']